ncbi:MAG: hypothetical protein OEW90_01750 [Betaproteobacteria bacterium]|nr:hypothetical protein [Betaproteobacteria bacterium]MDH4322843.1 hypothetical protein [Betaproteobacteria bacterium]
MASGTFGSAIYGAARAIQDERRFDLEEERFRKDEARQDERMSQERELQPLRRRALTQGIEKGDRELRITDLNLDIAKLKKGGMEREERALSEAQAKEKILKMGLGQFHSTGDPQHVANAFAQMFPEMAGGGEGGTHQFKAVRTDSGSIILTSPQGGERVLKGGKTKDGRQYSPDEELGMMAYKLYNPVEVLKKRLEADYGLEKEQVKADAAAERARIAAESREAVATTRAASAQAVADDRGIKLGKSFVDSGLKTTSIPGHFANVYSSEDDAKMVPHIYTKMGELVRNGEKPEEAAKKAITETRTEFAGAKREALDAATALGKSKVDPKDAEGVSRAAKNGDKAAQALMQAIGRIRRAYGDDVARYLFDQIPGKRR